MPRFGVLYQTVVISAAPMVLEPIRFHIGRFRHCVRYVPAGAHNSQLVLTPVYSYLVTNFGNPAIRSHLFKSVVIPVDLVALTVQQHPYHPNLLQRFDRGPGSTVATLGHGGARQLEDFTHDHYKTLTIACNIAAAVTNVLISVFLVYHLYILKRGDSRTDDIINRLIAFAFNTAPQMTVAPQTFIYMFWTIILYTNSLLVTLNTRNYVRSVIAPTTEPELTETVRYPSTILYSTYRPEESNTLSVRIDARGVAPGEEDFIAQRRIGSYILYRNLHITLIH
ncbi:hypothetical protein B0H14DRAFT_2571050 [Mycena olivaceomarginata]|nr:hypothetical protein B0H14DRAFT_2571050 [Mycena olivaceomarginata]